MNDVLRTYFDWELDYGANDISGKDNSVYPLSLKGGQGG